MLVFPLPACYLVASGNHAALAPSRLSAAAAQQEAGQGPNNSGGDGPRVLSDVTTRDSWHLIPPSQPARHPSLPSCLLTPRNRQPRRQAGRWWWHASIDSGRAVMRMQSHEPSWSPALTGVSPGRQAAAAVPAQARASWHSLWCSRGDKMAHSTHTFTQQLASGR